MSRLRCFPALLAVAFLAAGTALPAAQPQPSSKSQTQGSGKAVDPLNVDPMSLLPEQKNLQSQRVPIFFPPMPPPMDLPVAYGVTPPGRLAAPAELAMFVHEPFYAPLSTHLFANTLKPRLRQALGEYHANKSTLQQELRAELAKHRDAEPASRLQALQAFARMQTPKIEELEQTAEKLRRSLVTVPYSWTILREWHLGYKERRGFSPKEVSLVMRGYAHYQNGLLLRQRRLLQEIVMEMQAAVDDATLAGRAQPYFFFTPEPARIMLPANLPPELSDKIAAYSAKKSQMKEELYDAICKYDGGVIFRNPIRELARKQAPEFNQLDELADEIRRGLMQLGLDPPPEPGPKLPPVLVDRAAALLRDRAAAQRAATLRADAVIDRTYATRVQITYRFDDDGMRFVVAPGIGRTGPLSEAEDRFYEKVRLDLAKVADEYGTRLAELMNEQESIRVAAGEMLGTENRAMIDEILSGTNRVVSLRETEEAYRDYRQALFEPGLSPAQRRLLFDGAIARLDLPLPRGEMQITTRTKTW
jgi:hypothetical protein